MWTHWKRRVVGCLWEYYHDTIPSHMCQLSPDFPLIIFWQRAMDHKLQWIIHDTCQKIYHSFHNTTFSFWLKIMNAEWTHWKIYIAINCMPFFKKSKSSQVNILILYFYLLETGSYLPINKQNKTQKIDEEVWIRINLRVLRSHPPPFF